MKVHDIKNLEVTSQEIRFEISGIIISVPLQQTMSHILPKAGPQQLQIFEIDSYGIGIHWPLLDEDLSIAGLLRAAGREDLVVDPSRIQDDIQAKAS